VVVVYVVSGKEPVMVVTVGVMAEVVMVDTVAVNMPEALAGAIEVTVLPA